VKVGRFEVIPIADGSFRLDGGAMYGTVPKTLWCRHEQPDEHNRIPLCLGSLLIRTPTGKVGLVDAGLSSKYDRNEKFLKIFCVDRRVTLRDELKSHGLDAADVDFVINTHLHFDHAGGDTEIGPDGKIGPTFARARYFIQKEEWEDANHPHERNQASYLEENFAPLDRPGVLELVSGDYEIEPGLKVRRSGGHTRGHQCVMIESEGQTAVFMGDLIPTRAHVPLPYIMGYDLFPVDTLEAKRGMLKEAADRNWTVFFQHDVGRRHAKIALHEGRYVAVGDPNGR
jgi:glyoxylase-like metal-dependent hydrolase (beta-lactamase superfamily II)